MRAGADVRAWLLIAGSELRLLRRSAFAVVMAAVLPAALAALIVWAEGDTGKAGWPAAAGLSSVTLIAFTMYAAGTTNLVVRRQQFVLKRLRTSGASDTAVVAGVLTPFVVLTLLQTVLLFGIVAVADGRAPAAPWLPAVAVGAGTVVAGLLAVATATITSAAELAQLTTAPVALAFCGGGLWVAATAPGDVTWAMLALPGGSVTQLTRLGWHDAAPGGLTAAVAALLLVAAVGTPLAVRALRWDPRR